MIVLMILKCRPSTLSFKSKDSKDDDDIDEVDGIPAATKLNKASNLRSNEYLTYLKNNNQRSNVKNETLLKLIEKLYRGIGFYIIYILTLSPPAVLRDNLFRIFTFLVMFDLHSSTSLFSIQSRRSRKSNSVITYALNSKSKDAKEIYRSLTSLSNGIPSNIFEIFVGLISEFIKFSLRRIWDGILHLFTHIQIMKKDLLNELTKEITIPLTLVADVQAMIYLKQAFYKFISTKFGGKRKFSSPKIKHSFSFVELVRDTTPNSFTHWYALVGCCMEAFFLEHNKLGENLLALALTQRKEQRNGDDSSLEELNYYSFEIEQDIHYLTEFCVGWIVLEAKSLGWKIVEGLSSSMNVLNNTLNNSTKQSTEDEDGKENKIENTSTSPQ
ncbi:unnamed protein product [Rhizophagus irregularis]|nr:unnamed protein product [Rhizophagus irregularis]